MPTETAVAAIVRLAAKAAPAEMPGTSAAAMHIVLQFHNMEEH